MAAAANRIAKELSAHLAWLVAAAAAAELHICAANSDQLLSALLLEPLAAHSGAF